MRVSRSAAAALTLVVATVARADDGRPLSLVDATALALALNHEIGIERENHHIATASIDRAQGARDFSISVETAYSDRTDAVNSVLSGALPGSYGPTQEGLSTTASVSRLLSTGGTLDLSTSVARYDADNFLVGLTPFYTTSVGVEFRQPLLENLSIDPTRAAIRIARIEKTRSEASLRHVVSETVAAVERAYWSLVAARRDVEVREDSVRLAERQHHETAVRIEVGDLPKSGLAETTAAVQRRRGDVFAAEERVARAENALKALIASGPDDPLWNETLLPSDPLATSIESVDLDTALGQARALRADLAEARARIEQDAVEVEATRNRVRPRLDLVATYARHGLSGSANPDAISFPSQPPSDLPDLHGGLGRSYETIGENLFPSASIGLALELPVGDRTARADAAVAEATRRRSELTLAREIQQVDVEVRDAHAALRTATQRIDAARAGLEAAETQLRAETDAFEVGTSTSFLVLTRQNELAEARLTETAAMADYRKARVELDRAAGVLLSLRGIEFVEDAPSVGATGEAP